ncbi:lipase 3 precursor [Amylocarpus encephaloides]|uniref:Lipase 3 n=1 Tax=Amylocarpus encephaloides TaxID=45428 RepID=A0A9P7YPM1_9HELO|nr:lipase 3 precursor [Amylocarpus encephaloides]
MKLFFILLSVLPTVPAAPSGEIRAAAPSVAISSPSATIVGETSSSVDKFNGIPFAKPPTGALRLKPPQPLISALGTVNAVGTAKACPQMFFTSDTTDLPAGVLGLLLNTPLFQTITNAGEDCLTMNVFRPSGTIASSKLPVLFWIFGGGFELGSTGMYDGTSLVQESVANGKPIILVAVNYRVGGFGFMPGKEILADGSSNLGLLDQRLGLQWTADNIAAFGGGKSSARRRDPDKITIWGESAGAISVLDQMVLYNGDNTYKGKPLFRAGIMNSGSIVPAAPVDGPKGQAIYNEVVTAAGCSFAASSLDCLRALDYTKFLNAANSVPGILGYTSVALSYLPRPDGTALSQSPDILVANGQYAKIPIIIGDQEDEGTIFALFQSNITTTSGVASYLKDYFFGDASAAQMTSLVATYQNVATDGSPFRTLFLNNWYPQFKRIAAILGDLVFTLTRRVFLNTVADEVPAWSYLASYDYGTPVLGTFHGSDLLQVFFGIVPNYASRSIRDYYFNFVYSMDPNTGSKYMKWPQWKESKKLMNFYATGATLIDDDFRGDSYNWIVANLKSLYI